MMNHLPHTDKPDSPTIANWLRRQAVGKDAGTLANRLRKRRMQVFEAFFRETFRKELEEGRTLRIIDLGGTLSYWKSMGFAYADRVDITLVNLKAEAIPADFPSIHAIAGDATDLSGIPDGAFDLVYSNSCIEHVGKADAQARMAAEVQRVGRHFFLQTPNRYFPMEPHFLFPCYQFLPLKLRAWLILRRKLGHIRQAKSWEEALVTADSIHLLTCRSLRRLFPHATLMREWFCGLVKSYMLYQ